VTHLHGRVEGSAGDAEVDEQPPILTLPARCEVVHERDVAVPRLAVDVVRCAVVVLGDEPTAVVACDTRGVV
jgi:hypothetical protein